MREPVGMWIALFSSAIGGIVMVLVGPRLYEELKAWQTLIAGVLGFGGLAWVTYLTAQQSRQRDSELAREALSAERHRRDEKTKSLAMALGWELAHTLRELVTIRRRLMESAHRPDIAANLRSLGSQIASIPPAQVYARAVDRLLLPAEAIAKLSGLYYDLADLENLRTSSVAPAALLQAIDRIRLTIEAGNDALSELRQICGRRDFPTAFPT